MLDEVKIWCKGHVWGIDYVCGIKLYCAMTVRKKETEARDFIFCMNENGGINNESNE